MDNVALLYTVLLTRISSPSKTIVFSIPKEAFQLNPSVSLLGSFG